MKLGSISLTKTNRQHLFTLLSAGGLFLLFIWYGIKSTGSYYDDDIAHYLIARYSWQHPELFLNTWGRPAFTLLYAPVALLGFNAVKIFSAVIATATCLLSARLARQYQARWYWMAIIFTGLQSEFFRQAFSNLTELTFAALFILALVAYKDQRWLLMSVVVGWLPLARYESLPIVLLFSFPLIQHRKFWLLPVLVAPLLIHNTYWAVSEANLAMLFFPFDQLLGLRPYVAAFDYGAGDLFHYFNLLPVAFGGTILLLAFYGAWREKLGIPHLSILFAISTLSLTYWLVPSAGIAGYARHLAIVAPAVGMLATKGLEALISPYRQKIQAWGMMIVFVLLAVWLWAIDMKAISAVALVLGLVIIMPRIPRFTGYAITGLLIVVTIISTLTAVQPFSMNDRQLTAYEAGNWFRQSEYRDRLVLASHIYFQFSADLDGFDEQVSLPITPPNIKRAPTGSIIVWDSHYSHRLVWNTPLEVLLEDPLFHLLRTWENEQIRIYVFEKTGNS